MAKKVLKKIKEEQEDIAEFEAKSDQPRGLRWVFTGEFNMDTLDFITVAAGVFFIIFALFGVVDPIYSPALYFGIAIIITTAIHQWQFQVAVLAFTVIYWLGTIFFGAAFGMFEISLFIFGINTISLGVFLVGSIAVGAAGAVGFIEGTFRTVRWAGVIILLFSIILALVDFFFAIYAFAYPLVDALIVVGVNMAIYTICLAITFGIFYGLAIFYNFAKRQYESVGTEGGI